MQKKVVRYQESNPQLLDKFTLGIPGSNPDADLCYF